MPNGENNKYILEISRALARTEGSIDNIMNRLTGIEKKLSNLESEVNKTKIMLSANGGLKARMNDINKEVNIIQDKMDSLAILKGKMSVLMIIITALISATTSLLIYFLTH